MDYERLINIIEAHDGKPRNYADEIFKAVGKISSLLKLDTWTVKMIPGKGICTILSIEGRREAGERISPDQRNETCHSLKSGEIPSSDEL